MAGRIDPRTYRLGTGENADPDAIEDLRARVEKHERLTRGKPAKAFKEVLKRKMSGEPEEDAENQDQEQPEQQKGQKAPLLGLDPGQDSKIAKKGAKVIVKG
jgi:hypothetical protein